VQFAALFNVIWDKQNSDLDHSDGKCIELRMYLFIVENELHSAFPKTEIAFAYTCASCLPTVLESKNRHQKTFNMEALHFFRGG